MAQKLCECGCGERTTISTYNDLRYGYIKGKPRRFVAGHNVRVRDQPVSNQAREKIRRAQTGKTPSIETRKKLSDAHRGRKLTDTHRASLCTAWLERRTTPVTYSPFVPGLVVRWNVRLKRWFCHHPRTGTNSPHARVVYEHYFGEIPPGVHVHHCDGNSSRLEDDRPDNLMLLPPIWNRKYIPALTTGFRTTQAHVTEVYSRLQRSVSEEQLFAAICSALLKEHRSPELLHSQVENS
jgi:hypothetical protein